MLLALPYPYLHLCASWESYWSFFFVCLSLSVLLKFFNSSPLSLSLFGLFARLLQSTNAVEKISSKSWISSLQMWYGSLYYRNVSLVYICYVPIKKKKERSLLILCPQIGAQDSSASSIMKCFNYYIPCSIFNWAFFTTYVIYTQNILSIFSGFMCHMTVNFPCDYAGGFLNAFVL